MASFKNKKNLLQTRDEYARYFDNLRGVDFSSDQNDVDDSRLAYLVNMYRDYKSGQGGAIETIPGFREIYNFESGINGIHLGDNNIFIHVKRQLYWVGKIDEKGNVAFFENMKHISGIADAKSISFFYQGILYILCGGQYLKIEYTSDDSPYIVDLVGTPNRSYIPTRYISISPEAATDSNKEDAGEGKEYQQRNLLNPMYKMTYVAPGIPQENQSFDSFELKEPIDIEWNFESNKNEFPTFGTGFDVYQYGVRLPLAYNTGNGAPKIPEGYPNAITYVKNDPQTGNGRVSLVYAPPRPENNTWNPETKAFDYTNDEILNKLPEQDKYQWPFAYPTGYAGIEVTVTRFINTINGITNPSGDQYSIITKCTLVALFDNHVFLSGNPDFPRHVFYNVIRGDDPTGVPDATFFGQLNFTVEGSSNASVVGLMNVGDSLMVMKKDSDEDDSIIIHTAESLNDDITPKIYPSQRGHKGIGCLGPCYNFRDDPIFLSRLGVDALGHVSTKYRRAIKHRSSMIDARLLNYDLSKASITEWEGYLLILIDGRIFMADSRQMYNTPNGNTEYEWYYLEDIGIYEGQFDEYVYAEFGADISEEEIFEQTNGLHLIEAHSIRNEFGIKENLIGTVAFKSPDEITSVTVGDKTTYYKKVQEYDENGDVVVGSMLYLYVEPSGGKTGGVFDPAVLIKTIGNDLFFVTEKGHLCKFNFDMRDPDTGLIPNEYYDFNGRAIFSGCATKMDNCGIPHLTKTTVKRSTVIKTRTFESSGLKVKVRTNKKAFNQVARIVSGKANFENMDFETFTFSIKDKSIFSINEREKKWVEKQIFVYSDEFRRPFAIHYMAYRYNIAGRYKE